jgi:flap endonuclease-1
MIRNLTSHGTRKFGRVLQAEKIVLQDLLEMHEINYEQLVDLGIMIGTDFHEGIRGIGPKTGLKLIKKHGTMENVSIEKGFDLPENLAEIRELFRNHPVHSHPLPESSKSNEEKLTQFAKSRGFSDKRISRAITRLANSNRLKSDSQPTLFDF